MIYFSADSSKIVLEIPEIEGRNLVKELLVVDSLPRSWVTVLKQSSERDGLELEMDGNIAFTGEALIFTPIIPFQKGETYIVETVIGTSMGNYKDAFKSNINARGKRTSKQLTR